jgi:hypothetical protein
MTDPIFELGGRKKVSMPTPNRAASKFYSRGRLGTLMCTRDRLILEGCALPVHWPCVPEWYRKWEREREITIIDELKASVEEMILRQVSFFSYNRWDSCGMSCSELILDATTLHGYKNLLQALCSSATCSNPPNSTFRDDQSENRCE